MNIFRKMCHFSAVLGGELCTHQAFGKVGGELQNLADSSMFSPISQIDDARSCLQDLGEQKKSCVCDARLAGSFYIVNYSKKIHVWLASQKQDFFEPPKSCTGCGNDDARLCFQVAVQYFVKLRMQMSSATFDAKLGMQDLAGKM